MNLIEKIQKECDRCQSLKQQYDNIPMGQFGAHWIGVAIKEGKESIASGDVTKMLSAYKELEACE